MGGSQFQALLSSALGSSVPNGAYMTTVGGQGGSSTYFFASANRGSGGDPLVSLSTSPFGWTKNQQGIVGGYPASVLNANGLTGRGQGASVALGPPATPNTSSFSYQILGLGNSGTSVGSYLTSLPDTQISGGVAYEDLWFNNKGTGWVYEGYLTLDLTGGTTAMLTYSAVPEPSTYALLGCMGVVAVALRRRLSKKTA
jgi:hypothetical protein